MNCHVTTTSPLPRSHVHALRDPNWKEAMLDEYNALITNGTYKARLVANGRSQQQGIDYDETFSPVVKPATIRYDITYLLLYVDDIILTTSSSRSTFGLFLSQSKFAKEILARVHTQHCNPCKTPVDTKSKLSSDGDPVSNPTLYCSLAGALQYLTFTRPDISYVVQQVCLYMHDPHEPHFTALKHILRYVRGTVAFGLQLHASSTAQLTTYTDADWAGCLLLADLLQDILHAPLTTATLVYCDNVNAVYLSTNPIQHQRTKHIKNDIHFVQDYVASGQVLVLHVPSRFQYADIFTKGLPSALFCDFCSSLNVQIMINGSRSKEFKMERGLRQGDPLSLFLFLIVVEALQIAIIEAYNKGVFKGVSLAESKVNVSLLQYADDAFFFREWSRSNAKSLIYILKCFEMGSGLKINLSKSRLIGVRVPVRDFEGMAYSLGCSHDSLFFIYLGLLVGKRMRFCDGWSVVIDRFRDKFSFLTEEKALWNIVIKEFYGADCGFNFLANQLGSGGIWPDIINAIKSIDNIDSSLKSSFVWKVSSGQNTLFWKDPWCRSGVRLMESFPRLFALESHRDCNITSIGNPKVGKVLQGVFQISLWAIWKWRNRIMNAITDSILKIKEEDVFPIIQRLSKTWIAARLSSKPANWQTLFIELRLRMRM
uniref:Ribonuclease H-like domain-containing protein n=1 Tax=Tanacetum cinerariifolium TaxID=118510 RepID=A0A699I0U6_TANCI|nr:ribonuclease H-like domain-containing protein [Tanacetum cinerariifolium]